MREEIEGLSLYFVFSDFFYKGNLNVILKLYPASLKKGFFSGQLSFDNFVWFCSKRNPNCLLSNVFLSSL